MVLTAIAIITAAQCAPLLPGLLRWVRNSSPSGRFGRSCALYVHCLSDVELHYANVHLQCLACAICITVLLGCIKLGYTHWKLRKYAAVAEEEKKEQARHRQMSQRQRTIGTGASDEIPFGVRALERGVEVEGVWISRPNTPEAASRQSSVGSLMLQQFQRGSAEVDVEKQLPQGHDRTTSNSTTASARPASSSFDRAVSAERLPSSHASRDPSPDAAVTKPLRSRHPPCSYSKYSSGLPTYRHSSTMSTLEGLEAIHKASTILHADGSSGSSESSTGGNETEPISAAAPTLLTEPAPVVQRPRQQSVDFEMLNSHRMSLAAETGQLTPRTRKANQSVDWTSASLPASAITPSERSNDFERRRRASRASLSQDSSPISPVDPFASPKISALPAAVRRSSMPDVTPFAQFCQTAPPTPRPSSRSSSRESPPKARQQSEAQIAIAPPALNTSTPAPTPPEPAQQRPKRSSFEKRESQVMRGQGTGFEILKPGSLNPPPPAEHPMQRQRVTPPVSLHNAYRSRSRSSSADGRRKLQKKRRPSMDSQNSWDTAKSSNESVL